MQLIINGSIVDFERDNDQYLGQMILSLIYILKNQGHHHITISVNDKCLDLQDTSWHGDAFDSIKQIKVDSSIVMELEQCLTVIKKILRSIDTPGSIDPLVLASWDDHIESINFWLIDYKLGDAYFDTLRGLSLEKIEVEGVKETTINLLNNCLCMLEEKDRELDNPVAEFKAAIALLKGYRVSLEAVSTLFLRGSDQQAIKSMLPFIESIEKLRRCNFFLDDNYKALKKQCADFIDEIDINILMFSEACEKKDYILAGDIAEYEIAERLVMLDDFSVPSNLTENR